MKSIEDIETELRAELPIIDRMKVDIVDPRIVSQNSHRVDQEIRSASGEVIDRIPGHPSYRVTLEISDGSIYHKVEIIGSKVTTACLPKELK